MLTIRRVFKIVPASEVSEELSKRFEKEEDAERAARFRDGRIGARPGYYRVVPCHVIVAQQEKGEPLVVEIGEAVTLV